MFVSASWHSIQNENNFFLSSSRIEATCQQQQGLDTHKNLLENLVDEETSLFHPPDFTNLDPVESVTYSSEDNVSLNSYADFAKYVDADRVDKQFEDLDEYESFAHHVIV